MNTQNTWQDREIKISELYTVTRGQIEHINNNLAQRVIWLVIAQSFFFNGYALLVLGKPQNPSLMHIFSSLLIIVPIASLFTVVVTFIDVISWTYSLRCKRKNYDKYANPDECDFYPPINENAAQRFLAQATPILLPLMFMTVWIILLIYMREYRQQ